MPLDLKAHSALLHVDNLHAILDDIVSFLEYRDRMNAAANISPLRLSPITERANEATSLLSDIRIYIMNTDPGTDKHRGGVITSVNAT